MLSWNTRSIHILPKMYVHITKSINKLFIYDMKVFNKCKEMNSNPDRTLFSKIYNGVQPERGHTRTTGNWIQVIILTHILISLILFIQGTHGFEIVPHLVHSKRDLVMKF